MPAQSVGNQLQLDNIPDELGELSSLERHLFSRGIPFAKLAALPRGKQLAILGPFVNVPSVATTVEPLLPRIASDVSLIALKLKRRLRYRGYNMYGLYHQRKSC
jgi:hypothetical protein